MSKLPTGTHLEKTLARLEQVKSYFTTKQTSGRLAGKVAIVTGAGSLKGIGRQASLLYAKEGVKHIYVADLKIGDLVEFAKQIERDFPGVKATGVAADAASESEIAALCERAFNENGRLDVFFANAGILGFGLLDDESPEDFMTVQKVNVLGCFIAIKHASKYMKITGKDKAASGGSIILTASVAGLRFGAGQIDYSASKSAVVSLAQTTANVLAGTDVRVNAICPGLIETGMTAPTFDRVREKGTLAKVGQLNPLRRFGIPQEIAQASLFLASDDASYVNGIALPVDGGLSSSHPVVPGKFH